MRPKHIHLIHTISYLPSLEKEHRLLYPVLAQHPCARFLEAVAHRYAEEMNDSKHEPIPEIDPNNEPNPTTPQGESAGPDSVDQYMRHVGRTLYEIIRDWVKEQERVKSAETNEPALKAGDVLEGRTT